MNTERAAALRGVSYTRPVGPRPTVCCRRPEVGQVVPDPGTVVWAADGLAVVFVGDRPGLVDVVALAPRLREARRVDVVGDMWEAARPFKQALREAWNAAARAAREASRAPAAAKVVRERCGRPRADGQACQQWAGWGSATPGVGPCRWHGDTSLLGTRFAVVRVLGTGRRNGSPVYGVTGSGPGFMGLRVVRGGRRPEAEGR